MKVKIVSGCMTGRNGIVIGTTIKVATDIAWHLVKVDGLTEPVYFLGCELEILH